MRIKDSITIAVLREKIKGEFDIEEDTYLIAWVYQNKITALYNN